ncbi:class I SAM-dependent methyltransferase [Streptomyces sp. enrichment culture]|uniref:class I SAM-dependent methyltransferase n=1 Tax=Streptomyces sp. enrichment culture TaxID=1795815 RepID=UPI003F542FD7
MSQPAAHHDRPTRPSPGPGPHDDGGGTPHGHRHGGPHAHHHDPHDRCGRHGGPHHRHGADDQAELLDLDAEVLAEHLADITGGLPLAAPPRRILDLGCGTGAGTFALLDRFPDAQVTAVDASAAHLDRLTEKARVRGIDGRVRGLRADLDDPDWPDLGTPELVWASASMHHLADPGRALRAVHALLAPGGLFAVVELADFPRFLPADAPRERPGLEDRCHAVRAAFHAEHAPHRGADWGPMLADAGFTPAGTRTVTVHIDGARHPSVGAYALGSLRRLRQGIDSLLDAEDVAALDRLLDTDGPHSILRRDDLAVRTERTVWAARRTG